MKDNLWMEGLSDAVGFIGGALLGFWISRLLGLDIFAPGYGNNSMGAILLVGLGSGLGVKLARTWRAAQAAKASDSKD
jgi:hypothetical protein